jgi:hypothetical protein
MMVTVTMGSTKKQVRRLRIAGWIGEGRRSWEEFLRLGRSGSGGVFVEGGWGDLGGWEEE